MKVADVHTEQIKALLSATLNLMSLRLLKMIQIVENNEPAVTTWTQTHTHSHSTTPLCKTTANSPHTNTLLYILSYFE